MALLPQPYPSLVLHDLCDDGRMRQVRDEIINNIQATFKETDLFKVSPSFLCHPFPPSLCLRLLRRLRCSRPAT